ncbi:hypothetical protein CspeluHIS016_0204120 [Cutaneotrichosporon spelunceum]|uniref:Uncharacterized protein n=1 Tax=Cutaneotrichosporon spelunceum TaxID=1672016 RepID=A0AAD3Y9X3_9TREE|nr:hypothetical protein CspeluHIS016_0204120 [Cutaneotrichosporon spelunceum]
MYVQEPEFADHSSGTVSGTADTVPQPTVVTVAVTATVLPTPESSTISTGVTVALVLGLIVLVALVAFAAFLVLRRRRKARPHLVDPYATETMPMATLRSRTSIIKRPGGVGVLSSVNDRSVIAGRGWVRLDTEDRASFDYTYAESTNPPSYDHETSEWAGPSVQHPIGVGRAGGARGASTPTPGADATAFRAHGTNRNSAGFRMVRGPRADTPQDWREDGQGRQAGQEPRALGLDPVDTNRTAAPGPSESPSTPTAHSPPTPRASHLSHLSHVTSFRGELHRYDTFGRRREDTPSALFDVSDATVHTAIAGQRAGPAWAPAPQ